MTHKGKESSKNRRIADMRNGQYFWNRGRVFKEGTNQEKNPAPPSLRFILAESVAVVPRTVERLAEVSQGRAGKQATAHWPAGKTL